MNDFLLVSIIIPVYNRENFLQETIESVINQTYKSWELILVDDGSSDSSISISKIAAQNDNRILSVSRPNTKLGGGNSARNYGFQKSNGDLINWFDSDDIMHPEFIERKVDEFIGHKNLDVVFTKTTRTDFSEVNFPDERLKYSSTFLQDYVVRKISWYLPDAMFKRSFLEDKQLFDENLFAGQDRDFYIRLFAREFPKIKILDFYATYYRIHQDSISEKLYREANIKMQVSHYNSLINQVEVLSEYKLLSENLKHHYLKELKKRLPAILKSKVSLSKYFKEVKKLSDLNKTTAETWLKLFLAYFSFQIFGKGERFLK
jgi:glycosyltransferase involved in cell wall biosynthesis